jgi:hypothetical protein
MNQALANPTREEVKLRLADGKWPSLRWEEYMSGRQDELWDKVSELVVDGKSLPQIAVRHLGIPAKALKNWVNEDPKRLAEFNEMRLLSAHILAHETIDIADGAGQEEVPKAALRCKMRQWLASKLDKDSFGEQINHNVQINGLSETLRAISEKKQRERLLSCTARVIGEDHGKTEETADAHERQDANEGQAPLLGGA